MTRTEEYAELMKELENIPASDCVGNALKRRRRKQIWIRTWVSAAAVFCLFVSSINIFPAAAEACRDIPFLAQLTEILTFNPSLRKAVENDYLQMIALQETRGDITARVEYLIVDQKQVNIYYRLKSDKYERISADPEVCDENGHPVHANVSVRGLYDQQDELRSLTVDYLEADVPPTLLLTLKVYSNDWSSDAPLQTGDIYEEEMPDILEEFTFRLEFDPRFTAEGKTVHLDQHLVLNGQTVTITDMEIYPTHIRISVEEKEDNTAFLQNLNFYLELDNGKKMERVRNGISAAGNQNNPLLTSYRAESNYFEDADCVRMVITGADFLDKDREKFHVNLRTLEHDPLPAGVDGIYAVKSGHGWELSFRIRKTEDSHSQLLSGIYLDNTGKEYDIERYSSTMEFYDPETGEYTKEWGEETYYLQDLPEDEVWLNLNYTDFWTPVEPITVDLIAE